MKDLKKNKWKIIGVLAAAVVLAAAFWYGGNAPGLQGWSTEIENQQQAKNVLSENKEAEHESSASDSYEDEGQVKENPQGETNLPPFSDENMTKEEKLAAAEKIAEQAGLAAVPKGDKAYSEEQGMIIDSTTGKDKYLTDPVPKGKPLPVEPQDVKITDKGQTCTISISCSNIVKNISWLDAEKKELVPPDGWILKPTKVTFYEGESVFNVLQRTCKQEKIHMEFENTPMYNSAYIEGIHNLYEFDCGELSGWMYKVNDWFPNYGCSRYQLKDGDVICWVYTCDLGVDVGGYYSAGSK